MVSLVGCFVPRIGVYAKALRAQPPATPRHLDRLPAHASYETAESPQQVLDRAKLLLGGYRIREDEDARSLRQSAATSARPATCSSTSRCWSC